MVDFHCYIPHCCNLQHVSHDATNQQETTHCAVMYLIQMSLKQMRRCTVIHYYYTSIRSLSLERAFLGCFFMPIALSLSAVLRLNNITPGGMRREWWEGTQGENEITKKNFKKHIIGNIITFKDFLSVKICK